MTAPAGLAERATALRAAAPRYLALGVLALLLLLGLRSLFFSPAASAPAPAAATADAPSRAFALQFARAYLTFDVDRPAARSRALAPFLSDAVDAEAGFFAGDGRQEVVWAEVASDQPALTDGRAITIAAAISTQPLPVYLTVTVAHERGGPLSLVGYPAFVGAPAISRDAPSVSRSTVEDEQLTAVVARALRNYLVRLGSEPQGRLGSRRRGHPADPAPAGQVGRADRLAGAQRRPRRARDRRSDRRSRRHLHARLRTGDRDPRPPLHRLHRGHPDLRLTTHEPEERHQMKRRIAVTVGSVVLLLAAFAAAQPTGSTVLRAGGLDTAEAAVSKSLGQGGGGDVSGAGDRLGGLLSKVGAPIVIAVAGFFLLGALAARNVGASVGVVLITLVALIFLVSPESIESLAKGIAETVF